MEFKVLKKSKRTRARLGLIKATFGEIETPAFVPVATNASLRTLTSEEIVETKSQVLIANAFHLHLKPGEKIVKNQGGLHRFMNWKKPLMTDSGGFQVFSLGFGLDFGIGKILKGEEREKVKNEAQPNYLKISDEGVLFRSPFDGKGLFLTPEKSIKIQEDLGADIIFAFDECPPPNADYEYNKKAMERTHYWAKRSLKAKKSAQAIFGIIQGGKFKSLRKKSARFISSLDFEGFGIGGEFGGSKKKMIEILNWVIEELPEDKPRHLLGIGYLEDISEIVKEGVDLFDCVVPTRYARHGIAFVSNIKGVVDLKKSEMLKRKGPLDKNCSCFVCRNYSLAYLSHLFRAKEITALTLLTFHNLYFFNSFVEGIRKKIKQGRL